MTHINNQLINLEDFNQYINYNSTKIMKCLPQNVKPFLDLIVTSPPYWNMKKYGDVEQTGHSQTYEEYLDDIQVTFENIYKLSKDTATLYVNSDTIKRGGRLIRLPDDIARRLENIGWIQKDVIIWDKGKTLPWSHKGQMRNTFEYIHMFVKTENYKYYIDRIKTVDLKEWWVDYPERYSPEGKVPDNIWEFNIPTQGSWGTKIDFGEREFRHACPFPPGMMARLIKLSSDEGDVVFDPYAGTGVLLATAENFNRKYLGLDTNPDYKEVFEHVTKPLIKETVIDIDYYYEHQEHLKSLLSEAIYKLRILKFPKAIIRRFVRDQDMNSPFIGVFAIEEQLDDEQEEKNKIGKVSYYFISNPSFNNNNNDNYSILKSLSENAPFSKYGLILHIQVITVDEAIHLFNKQGKDVYLYSDGVVNDQHGRITSDKFIRLIQDEEVNKKHTFKDTPPIISNVNMTLEDYVEILPEKHKKRND